KGRKGADTLSAFNGALYLTFRDKALSNAYFGKINMLKDLLPKGVAEFVDRDDGVLVVAIKEKRNTLLHVAYHDGVLAAIFGGPDNVDRAVAHMMAADAPAPTGDVAELLQSGATWGFATDMVPVLAFLSARYEIVKLQINRFLAPLRRASLVVRFDEAGLGIDLSVAMRAGE